MKDSIEQNVQKIANNKTHERFRRTKHERLRRTKHAKGSK